MKLLTFASLTVLSLLLLGGGEVAAKNFPTPKGFVSDCCLLSSAERVELNNELSTFQQQTGNQIAVAVVQSLEGDSVENYANELFRNWKLGEKGKNNGVLLLLSIQEKKIRIEVGYGLEGVLTDALSSRIIRDEITPAMKNKEYKTAIFGGVHALMGAAKNEYNEATPSLYSKTNSGDGFGNFIGYIFGFFFIFGNVIAYFFAYMARSKSIWAGGIMGGILGIILMLFMGVGIGTIITLIALTIGGFILDAVPSSTYSNLKSQGKSTSFWDTGGGFFTSSGGGSSSSGSDFGGFGGGSSGGGGASGGW